MLGQEAEDHPKAPKTGDAIHMVPSKAMCAETFSECPPLGHLAMRDMKQTVVIGVIKAVDKKSPTSGKATESAATASKK